MGSLVGHVAPGVGFFLIGLWHLFNNIRLHVRSPSSYSSLPWFPAPRIRYLELYVILFGCSLSVAMELFIGPDRHQPLDPDGTIPSNHLRNFEHSLVSISLSVYAAVAIVFDLMAGPAKARSGVLFDLTQLVGAMAFAQELLLFHLHSTDHKGLEGQYHLLLQMVVFVSLTTTLIGIAVPTSFVVIFVRSVSILLQGIWFIVMGFMLWTPELMPKSCFINNENGHLIARCHNDEALHRAKSLVNIEFSWLLIGVTIFSVSLYLILAKIYGDKVQYHSLDTQTNDVESQKISKILSHESSESFIQLGKIYNL
ncbi:transmembrane protein 45A-like [Punica granatum]|uniref:Uncharacterized protein n=2 Tax=Punica granatum TaxID=22663 RepID=A0A218WKQ7_PUNGR|nr:transmembrane protein 45A-like [Punica granatum]OWM73417.1 hypothetical protein CDL15_Pgr026516 [Punica granatum]PKI43151.1 hypothetical protein CRG98_036457 [Punica granatum]